MRVAVVGSGVSGLGALWALNEYSEHEVHLFEEDSRPGGHANTVDYTAPSTGLTTPVDTGFIVLNPPSYPNFLSFLNHLHIPTLPTEMTFSVSRDKGLFEWAGNNVFTVFCQPKNLFRLGHWRLIWDVLRFNVSANKFVEEVLGKEGIKGAENAGAGVEEGDISIGEYLDREGYSDSFKDDYLIPMTAAVWSTSPDKCSLHFPARTLLRFMHNHHLLQLTGKPSWLTISGGSHVYVRKILEKVSKDRIHIGRGVVSARNVLVEGGKKKGVEIRFKDTGEGEGGGEKSEIFDAVIFATHSDTTLKILGENASDREKEILGAFGWSYNEAVLHCDTELMPKAKSAWCCWNYLTFTEVDAKGAKKSNVDRVALTYSMNLLQHIPQKKYGDVLVTLNPPFEPRPDLTAGRWKYSHPIVSVEGIRAQDLLPSIQNTRGIMYAGAWTKYGFHEDGFTSGIRLAVEHLGAKLPFEIASPDRDARRSSAEVLVGRGFEAAEHVRRLLSWFLFSIVFLGLLG